MEAWAELWPAVPLLFPAARHLYAAVGFEEDLFFIMLYYKLISP